MISPPPDQPPERGAVTATGRYPEMQGLLDHWLYHPLSARLARLLARTGVTPNMVSIAGGAAIVLAGVIYLQPGWPLAAIAGLIIHMSWHVLDGADGDLARLTGRTSAAGEIVDGICDYAGHIALYLMLAAAASTSWGWAAWALAVGAGASRVVQANFHETQRRRYLALVHGRDWIGTQQGPEAQTRLGKLGQGYVALAQWLSPGDAALERAASDPATRASIRAHLARLGPSSLAGSALLGANGRTIALGLLMLVGSPVWFFLFEMTVLNALLLSGRRRCHRTVQTLCPSTRR